MYCFINFSWNLVADMRKTKECLFLTSHEGKLWAIGGYNISEDLSSFLVYDPEIDSWSGTQVPMESIKGGVKGCTFISKYIS